jgi:hypothetical protein
LRFNDIMQTVLAGEGEGHGAITLWRQCVDLLAQYDRPDRPPLPPEDRAALLQRLEALRPMVSETQRIATVVELGGRLGSPELVRFFAQDRPPICAAAIARAHLPDSVWLGLLPELGPTARGVMRGRSDLSADLVRGLESFGHIDLALPSSAFAPAMPEGANDDDGALLLEDAAEAAEEPSPIRRLVDRIERFTATHRERLIGDAVDEDAFDTAAFPDAHPAAVRAFAFETDATGVIIWVSDGPRAALVGLTLSEAPLPGGSGPDGNVAGAFSRRSGFRNGRFTIAGGPLNGEWRVTGMPVFDPRSGRFQGFRGEARRPHLHEVAAQPPSSDMLALGGLSADSVRQLVHELRTPLNAIMGFAEIIEQQLFGPAGQEYRQMAGQIVADARHLLAAFDDLDLAARVARGEAPSAPKALDPGLLIARVAMRFHDDGTSGGRSVDIAMPTELPAANVDPARTERMVQHLLRTLVSVCAPGEGVTGACSHRPGNDAGMIVLAFDRPRALGGLEEPELLDPGYGEDGDWPEAPLLGLGFSLRLVRSLATSLGGALEVTPDHIVLSLPALSSGMKDETAAH